MEPKQRRVGANQAKLLADEWEVSSMLDYRGCWPATFLSILA